MVENRVRVGLGTHLIYEGESAEVIELSTAATGVHVTLRVGSSGQQLVRTSLRELLDGGRARVISAEEYGDRPADPAAVILSDLSEAELESVRTRAAHVREVLSGYRSGHPELAGPGEPRTEFDPRKPLMERYQAKAAELGITVRTIGNWVSDYRDHGEAGLVRSRAT